MVYAANGCKIHVFIKRPWNHVVKICLNNFENNAGQGDFLS